MESENYPNERQEKTKSKKKMSQNRKNRNKLNGKTIINAREKKEMRFSSFFYSFLHTTTATMKPLPSTLWTMN